MNELALIRLDNNEGVVGVLKDRIVHSWDQRVLNVTVLKGM